MPYSREGGYHYCGFVPAPPECNTTAGDMTQDTSTVGVHTDSLQAHALFEEALHGLDTQSISEHFVADIAQHLQAANESGLQRITNDIRQSWSSPPDAVYLEKEARITHTHGLAKLIALTAIPHLTARLQKIILVVTGPGKQDHVCETTLETQPVVLGWQARLILYWAVLGDDRQKIEKMAVLALTEILRSAHIAKIKPRFRLSYDRGWEGGANANGKKTKKPPRRNCDITLSAFLAAWARSAVPVQSLELLGDVGCSDVDPGVDLKHVAGTLRFLDIDLHQRNTSEAPPKLLMLLETAKNIERLFLRWNLTPANTGGGVWEPIVKKHGHLTRSHNIRDFTLHGVHGTTDDFLCILRKLKMSTRTPKIRRVELSDVVLVHDEESKDGWREILGYLAQNFELKEIRLRYLCSESGGMWKVGGEVDFAVGGKNDIGGREEVAACLKMVAAKGAMVHGGRRKRKR